MVIQYLPLSLAPDAQNCLQSFFAVFRANSLRQAECENAQSFQVIMLTQTQLHRSPFSPYHGKAVTFTRRRKLGDVN